MGRMLTQEGCSAPCCWTNPTIHIETGMTSETIFCVAGRGQQLGKAWPKVRSSFTKCSGGLGGVHAAHWLHERREGSRGGPKQ